MVMVWCGDGGGRWGSCVGWRAVGWLQHLRWPSEVLRWEGVGSSWISCMPGCRCRCRLQARGGWVGGQDVHAVGTNTPPGQTNRELERMPHALQLRANAGQQQSWGDVPGFAAGSMKPLLTEMLLI